RRRYRWGPGRGAPGCVPGRRCGSLAGYGQPFGHSRSPREQLMKVAVLMGSASDKAKMAPATEMLAQLGVEAVEEVMSAHRTPEVVAGFAGQARELGYGAI